MYPFKVLNHEDIKSILDMKNVIDIVEKAYVLKENKEASLFPMVFHEFEPGKADMDIKSGELSGAEEQSEPEEGDAYGAGRKDGGC